MVSSKAVAWACGVQQNAVLKNFSKFSGIFSGVSLNGSFCVLGKDLKQLIKGVLKIFTKL